VSEDWSFVELVTTTRAALSSRDTGRPVRARLGLRRTLHTVREGMVLPYTRAVIIFPETRETRGIRPEALWIRARSGAHQEVPEVEASADPAHRQE
jgi:hypothetical protein